MKWSDVGELVKEGAPLIGAILAAPISAPVAIISLVTTALGLKANSSPQEVYDVIKSNPDALHTLSQVQLENHHEIEKIYLKFETHQADNVRHSMLKEYTIDNKFKSYWRPSFGYMLVIVIPILILWLMGLSTYVFLFAQSQLLMLQQVLELILQPIFNLLLWCITVLGINILHRSKDKASLLGMDKGLLGNLKDAFKRN